MDEMIKEWFGNLIDDEIEQEIGTISNESVWAMSGSIHLQNIPAHKKYIDFLKDIKSKYCG